MKRVFEYLYIICLITICYTGVYMVARNSYDVLDLSPWVFGLILVYVFTYSGFMFLWKEFSNNECE